MKHPVVRLLAVIVAAEPTGACAGDRVRAPVQHEPTCPLPAIGWATLLTSGELEAVKTALIPRSPSMEQVELVAGQGARVHGIQAPSVLRLLGLQDGDTIVRIDDTPIRTEESLHQALGHLGGKGSFVLQRAGAENHVEYTLQLASPAAPERLLEALAGCWTLPHGAELRIAREASAWTWEVRRPGERLVTKSTFTSRYSAQSHSVSLPCGAASSTGTCTITASGSGAVLLSNADRVPLARCRVTVEDP